MIDLTIKERRKYLMDTQRLHNGQKSETIRFLGDVSNEDGAYLTALLMTQRTPKDMKEFFAKLGKRKASDWVLQAVYTFTFIGWLSCLESMQAMRLAEIESEISEKGDTDDGVKKA